MKDKSVLGKVILFLTTIIWGSTFFILKNTIEVLPTAFVLALRFVISAIFLIILFPKKMKLSKGVIKNGCIVGIVIVVAYLIQTYGLNFTTPSKSSFLTDIYIILIPFMMWIFDKKKPSIFNFIGAFLCFGGIILICFGGGETIQIGDTLTIVSGFLYAVEIYIIGKFAKNDDPIQLVIVEMITGAILFSIFTAIFELPGANISISANDWILIMYLSIFCTALALVFQTIGQKYVQSGEASLILSLEGIFATLFSVIFYHEKMFWYLIVGFSLVFVAIIIGDVLPELIKDRKNKSKNKNFNNEENAQN